MSPADSSGKFIGVLWRIVADCGALSSSVAENWRPILSPVSPSASGLVRSGPIWSDPAVGGPALPGPASAGDPTAGSRLPPVGSNLWLLVAGLAGWPSRSYLRFLTHDAVVASYVTRRPVESAGCPPG